MTYDAALPDGLTSRPLTPADARAVYEVMAAQQRVDVGSAEIEEADIVADWQRPSYDLGASSVGVLDGDRLVACAEVMAAGRADVGVHPDHRGRGIGTWLAGWIRAKGREQGVAEVGMPQPEGSAGDRLMESLGFHVRWHSWVLTLPEGTTVPDRPLPEGYTVRAATEEEHPAAYAVQEDAFLEWSKRERDTFEEWQAGTVRRPGFEPWHLRVVLDPAGEVVAMAFLVMFPREEGGTEAYVDRLATRRDQRGRGLAQALLVDAFRVGAEHGAVTSSLSTDSRTGALGLYEKVGMVVTQNWVNRGIAT